MMVLEALFEMNLSNLDDDLVSSKWQQFLWQPALALGLADVQSLEAVHQPFAPRGPMDLLPALVVG